MYEKLRKCPNFTLYLPEKLARYPNFYICPKSGKGNKISEFHMIFVRNMPEFYLIIAIKIFLPDFFFLGGGHMPPAPVSYAYMFTKKSPHLFLGKDFRYK